MYGKRAKRAFRHNSQSGRQILGEPAMQNNKANKKVLYKSKSPKIQDFYQML